MKRPLPRPFVVLVVVLAFSPTFAACAVDGTGTSDDQETESAWRTRASRDVATPLSGDEVRFEKFLHVDASTAWWPSHHYPEYHARVHVGSDTYFVSAALYLETDRSFTLYYAESLAVAQYSGKPVTARKLTGTWSVQGAALKLGTGAEAVAAKMHDGFGHNVEGLTVSLPAGWAGNGLSSTIALTVGVTNVGPRAPFWSSYR